MFMKTTLMVASLLLAAGCATVDLNSEGGGSVAQTEQPDIMQHLADNSQGK